MLKLLESIENCPNATHSFNNNYFQKVIAFKIQGKDARMVLSSIMPKR